MSESPVPGRILELGGGPSMGWPYTTFEVDELTDMNGGWLHGDERWAVARRRMEGMNGRTVVSVRAGYVLGMCVRASTRDEI